MNKLTAKDLARMISVDHQTLLNYINFRSCLLIENREKIFNYFYNIDNSLKFNDFFPEDLVDYNKLFGKSKRKTFDVDLKLCLGQDSLNSIAIPSTLDSDIDREKLSRHFRNFIKIKLNDFSYKVITMHYGIDCDREYTIDEMAKHFKCSRAKIEKNEKRSLSKIYKLGRRLANGTLDKNDMIAFKNVDIHALCDFIKEFKDKYSLPSIQVY